MGLALSSFAVFRVRDLCKLSTISEIYDVKSILLNNSKIAAANKVIRITAQCTLTTERAPMVNI